MWQRAPARRQPTLIRGWPAEQGRKHAPNSLIILRRRRDVKGAAGAGKGVRTKCHQQWNLFLFSSNAVSVCCFMHLM